LDRTETRGAARIDAQSGKAEWFGERQGLVGKAAYTLRFDREQRLWAATEAGLFLAMPPYRKFSRITELPPTRIWAVTEARMARFGLEAPAGYMNSQQASGRT